MRTTVGRRYGASIRVVKTETISPRVGFKRPSVATQQERGASRDFS